MTQMVLSEKGLQKKKKVSPPSSTKAHPLKDIQDELSQFLNYKLQIQSIQYTKNKHTFTSCLVTRKIISPTLGKTCLYKTEMESLT